MVYIHLLYKVQCFIRISGTDKTDNLTCEIITPPAVGEAEF